MAAPVAARRVAILEHAGASASATGVRGRAIAEFLRTRGHQVGVLAPTEAQMASFRRACISVRARVSRRLHGRPALPHLWDVVADWLEPIVRRGQYDVLIVRSPEVGGVFARGIAGVKIYDMSNLGFLEEYHGWGANLRQVEETYDRELQLFETCDHILSPHARLTAYFARHFAARPDLVAKVRTVRLGAEPATLQARFAAEARAVYAGSYYYIQDPYLLCELARRSPIPIDCYGFRDPNHRFLPGQLRYCGFRETTDFLADYQFGVITVSRDTLRQNTPSTKFPCYFAHGLPVLFPEWMKEGHDYPAAALPYDEDTFADRVRGASSAARWRELSAAASEYARHLTWDNVLQPLRRLIG